MEFALVEFQSGKIQQALKSIDQLEAIAFAKNAPKRSEQRMAYVWAAVNEVEKAALRFKRIRKDKEKAAFLLHMVKGATGVPIY